MKNFTLDGRLASAAKFVRQGARFADIGTDHAYLPIFLLREGIISYAVCSDINEGPLASARENAWEAGVYEKTEFTLANGADGIREKEITDVAVCGMGGELISQIISRANFLMREGVRLILQPMSKFSAVREMLFSLGYTVFAEEYSSSLGKLYVTICADYTGVKKTYSDEEAEFGEARFLDNIAGDKLNFLLKRQDALKRAADGKRLGGEDNSRELRLYEYISNILTNGGAKVDG